MLLDILVDIKFITIVVISWKTEKLSTHKVITIKLKTFQILDTFF